MNWPVVTDAPSGVQLTMAIGCTLIGVSHVLQPAVWRDYFAELHRHGAAGVLTRTMTWELWPALVIVALHPVWTGPGALLTIYGWLLLAKCTVGLLLPQVSVRSLAQREPAAFVVGGAVSIGIGLASAAALVWR